MAEGTTVTKGATVTQKDTLKTCQKFANMLWQSCHRSDDGKDEDLLVRWNGFWRNAIVCMFSYKYNFYLQSVF